MNPINFNRSYFSRLSQQYSDKYHTALQKLIITALKLLLTKASVYDPGLHLKSRHIAY